jgi:DNA-binding MarR family transcriptional regulator
MSAAAFAYEKLSSHFPGQPRPLACYLLTCARKHRLRDIAMTPILDSRKLLAFTTLARVGSFTHAARELHLTQSAVSHAIKSLEQDLECRLFDRLGRHVNLTAAGRQLLEHADKILTEMKNAREDLEALGKGLTAGR